ncbi:MAG: tRNA (adenosine(37)-N6)-dimethylallyltransferase MiaA [Gemmatimonadota bacterium]|jgi:tRNA dimethylallyltransferase
MESPAFLAIVGPTASGKTSLSLEVVKRIPGEIISMDSRQVYRGMDIGTGKVGLRERALAPHHGLDLRDPDERYSAGQFARDAREWIRDIRGRGRVPILVGGTGFFLKSLTDPMFQEPELDGDRLEGIRAFLNRLSMDRLAAFVSVLDPQREADSEGGRQRATRTVEIALLTGRPLSWWHRESQPAHEPLQGLIALVELSRELLYDRINRRVEEMMEEGLVDEVRRLLEAGYGPEDPGMTGSGYREIVTYLGGELTLEEAVAEIQGSHRKYARRQSTWYRHQLPPEVLLLDGSEGPVGMAERVVAQWKAMTGNGMREAQ